MGWRLCHSVRAVLETLNFEATKPRGWARGWWNFNVRVHMRYCFEVGSVDSLEDLPSLSCFQQFLHVIDLNLLACMQHGCLLAKIFVLS